MERRFQSSMLQKVIELESNDGRFEGFCREAVSILEGGAKVLATSKSWDLGRDGVGYGVAKGIYVCCSLRDDVDVKAISDIERLRETTKNIGHIYFCSSKALSEHRLTQIETELRDMLDFSIPVSCLGALQLAETVSDSQSVVDRYYGAELDDCYRTVTSEASNETEKTGLRLALMAMSGDDSHEIRAEIYSASILDVLSEAGAGLSARTCALKISGNLKLGTPLAEEVLRPHIQSLEQRGMVKRAGNVIEITEAGKDKRRVDEIAAGERLIIGKQDVRIALEASMGGKFSDAHFDRIWTVFEDRMAHYFNVKGHTIVAEINAILLGGEGDKKGKIEPFSFLDDFAKVVSETSSLPQQREELALAIKDLFCDRTSKATDWLVKVSASYMAACALGLEHSCGKAIAKLFARTHLVIDTDVALSLLCVGEPEHEAVSSIVGRWTRNNGKVLVGEPVLQEVAYHAHIAQRDFDQTRHFLPGTPEERLHLIENAFVRAFAELLAKQEAKPSQWKDYIRQFKGVDSKDWINVFGFLSIEHSIEKLPPRSSAEESLERNVRKFLTDQAEAKIANGNIHIARDKARRDAELYSSLVHYMSSLRKVDPGATCLLVSSAHRLMSAEAEFHQTGEAQIVVSIATVLHLLSMLPSVSLGLSAMKVFLFDERRSGFNSDLERTLLRMIKTSSEVSMPFAKRGVLMRHVRDKMIENARRQGVRENRISEASMEKEALKDENKESTIQILAESLDALALDTRLEAENRKLRLKLAEMERQLDEERTKRRR